MSLPWIRVSTALLDDPAVRQFGAEMLPKVEPWAARAAGAGFLVALWGKVASHQPDGCVGPRDDEQLEEWAQWKGKPGMFAGAFRARFLDDNGLIHHWQEYQGAALARREADRVRKATSRNASKSPELPREVTLRPLRTFSQAPRVFGNGVRVTSGRNGDGTDLLEKGSTAVLNTDLSKGEPSPQNRVENFVDESEYADPSPVVTRFMAHFYRDSTRERRADVARQMSGAIIHKGVTFKGEIVKALDEAHLDDCCLEVMEDPPRDFNAAWVFVLQRLKESYLRTLSDRAKALTAKRPVLPEGMTGDAPAGATPLRAAIAGVLDGLGSAQEPEDDE